MPWLAIELKPGVNSELTATALRAGYTSTWLMRFKSGLAQKLGGWSKFINLLVGGSPTAIHAWQALNGTKYAAIGTTSELDALTAAPTKQNLTPQTFLSDCTANFTTTLGSNIVTVVDANISTMTPSCSVYFNTPISIDGIILSGLYGIQSTVSSTSYTIQAASNGLAGVSNGGAVPSFTTTSGSSSVTVTLTKHGLSVGGDIVFPIATTVGGVTIQGRYVVTSVTDANNFVVTATAAASSSAGPTSMNSGNAELLYYISTSPLQAGGNYGAGNYGAGAYGSGQVLVGQTGTPITSTDWTLGNWGEDLIACTENGGIFYWGPSSGYLNATMIPTAPPFNTGAFISNAQQMVIAYGSSALASIGTYQDPLLVKWSDVQNFFQWTPAITNQAGSFRLSSGSRIVGGGATPTTNLLWTDLDLWMTNYAGQQFVFGFVKVGSNCGLIAKHAWTQLANNVYWMGRNNFFVMSGGGVSILPCTVWSEVFQDLDTANASKCFAGSNTLFSEVGFFYPSIQDGLGYPSRYVKFNTSENTWDFGSLQRNCWTDQSILGAPLACTNTGIIYSHETGADADTSPMTSGFTTGYFYLGEGEDFAFVDQIMPDFIWESVGGSQSANIQITVNAVRYPGDNPVSYGPYTINQSNQYISTRIRARQFSLTVQSQDSGSFWRLGRIRVRFAPDGRWG